MASSLKGLQDLVVLLNRLALGLFFLLAGAHLFFSGSGPFHTNVVFLTLALLLAVIGPGSLSADTLWPRRRRSF
jgi:uncharacterized membrane protein YphA (DoxX/SURF4 family)